MTHAQRSVPYAVACLLALAARVGGAQMLPAAPPAELGLSSEALARIAPMLQAYVDSGKLAGMVAFVARRGKLAYAQAIGSADVENNTPMRIDGVFRMYSMTKPVIAVAIMKLVDQGAVQLEDPVAKFLPAFASTKVYAGGPSADPTLRVPARPITIEHLLVHSSGLTYGYFGLTPVDSIYRRANLLDDSRTVRQFADSIAKLPLISSPGDAWNYSMSIDVLGAVIEVASGRTLDKYLEDEVFTPLGMQETAFRVTPAMEGRIPVLYSRGPDGRLQASAPLVGAGYQSTSVFLGGGAGLLSTPADYLRFAQMLLNGGELDGRRVLSRESVANIMRNHLPAALTPIESPAIGLPGYGYGLGGAVLVDSARAQLPGSPGIYRWWGLMGTFFWVDPKAELIGMIWTQFNSGRRYPIERDFQRLVYAAIQR